MISLIYLPLPTEETSYSNYTMWKRLLDSPDTLLQPDLPFSAFQSPWRSTSRGHLRPWSSKQMRPWRTGKYFNLQRELQGNSCKPGRMSRCTATLRGERTSWRPYIHSPPALNPLIASWPCTAQTGTPEWSPTAPPLSPLRVRHLLRPIRPRLSWRPRPVLLTWRRRPGREGAGGGGGGSRSGHVGSPRASGARRCRRRGHGAGGGAMLPPPRWVLGSPGVCVCEGWRLRLRGCEGRRLRLGNRLRCEKHPRGVRGRGWRRCEGRPQGVGGRWLRRCEGRPRGVRGGRRRRCEGQPRGVRGRRRYQAGPRRFPACPEGRGGACPGGSDSCFPEAGVRFRAFPFLAKINGVSL